MSATDTSQLKILSLDDSHSDSYLAFAGVKRVGGRFQLISTMPSKQLLSKSESADDRWRVTHRGKKFPLLLLLINQDWIWFISPFADTVVKKLWPWTSRQVNLIFPHLCPPSDIGWGLARWLSFVPGSVEETGCFNFSEWAVVSSEHHN